MKDTMKQILSLTLALMMVVSLIPTTVFATESEDEPVMCETAGCILQAHEGDAHKYCNTEGCTVTGAHEAAACVVPPVMCTTDGCILDAHEGDAHKYCNTEGCKLAATGKHASCDTAVDVPPVTCDGTEGCPVDLAGTHQEDCQKVIKAATPDPVDEDPIVAQVGDQSFTDIQEAIKAAAPSGTVRLLADVTVDKWLMFSQTLSIASGQIIHLDAINGLTIDGNGKTLTIKDVESAGNGGYLFYDADKLNVKNLTIECVGSAVNKGGIGLSSGTIEKVTFNGGQGVFPGTGNVAIKACKFQTNGPAIYFEGDRDNLVVTRNTFETAAGQYAIYLRGKVTFTNNKIISGKVNVVNGSPVVTGNDFKNERLKVYNGATATISDNTINNLVFDDDTKTESDFSGGNTLSESAQASLNAVNFIRVETLAELQEAVKTANSAIKVDAIIKINAGESVTLDLNGCTVDLDQYCIENRGTLHIKNGTLSGNTTAYSVIESYGDLTVTDLTATGLKHILRPRAGKATINSGTFQVLGKSKSTLHALNAGDDDTAAEVTIKGGTFIGPLGTNADSGSAVQVQKGSVTISGGEFTKGMNNVLSKGEGATLILTGGTYDQDVSAFCAEGYKTKAIDGGKWQVVEKEYVAQIGTGETAEKFESIADAISSINTSETVTITVLADHTVESSGVAEEPNLITIPAAAKVVLDLNKKTITMPGIMNYGTLEVKNGTIVGNNANYSVVENNGADAKLTANFTVKSERHAIRADGGVVTVKGGSYSIQNGTGMTLYALNASSGAQVTIEDGTFVGPGTGRDSGAAINAKGENTLVTIQGGNFSKGINWTLNAEKQANIVITGGIFDQDPSASEINGSAEKRNYVAEGHGVTEVEAGYKVHKHDFETTWTENEEKTHHYHACKETGCEEQTGYGQHTGGTATCKDQALCSTCGLPYGNTDPHDLKPVTQIDPTFTSEGTKAHYLCANEGCDSRFWDAKGENPVADVKALKIDKLISINSSKVVVVSDEAVDELTEDGDLYLNLTDKDIVGEGNTGAASVEISTGKLKTLEGDLIITTTTGEITFNNKAIQALCKEAGCPGITITFYEGKEADMLTAEQKAALKTKKLKDKSDIIRVVVKDCDGNYLASKAAGGFGEGGKVYIEVDHSVDIGTKSTDYSAYCITDKLSAVGLKFLSKTRAQITLEHLSDYIIARPPKATISANTGDSSNILLWAGICAAAAVALGGVLIIGAKKKKK